jgi:Thioredoxin-like
MIFLLAALLWQSDWNTAFAQAKQQHKLVFVDYYSAKCAPCQEVERVVLPNATMQRELGGFVVLKVDLDRGAIPQAHRHAAPAYVVFDWDGRERFRIDGTGADLHADDWHQIWDVKNLNYALYGPLDTFRAAAPAFVKAAELFDAKRDLDANFLVASAYHRLMMTEHARAAYAEAKKVALREGKPAIAQSADVQSAYTYVTERHAPQAIELLKPLTKTPANREAETLIWLTLGHAYEAATDKPDAVAAFRKAQSLAAAGSRAQKEAAAALTRLQ